MANLVPFMEKLHITNKVGQDLLLGDCMTWPQRDLIMRVESDITAQKPVRYIILKARQIGMSTVIEGLMFAHAMARQNFRGTVLAHHNTSAQHLLSMTKYYYDTFWAKGAYKPKFAGQNQLAWDGVNSHLRIATASSPEAGRGLTPQFLHGSEVGMWDKADELMSGLGQSIGRLPGTSIFLESTAKGVGGYFYSMWERAVAKESNYIPLFYPYWAHPDYTAEQIGCGDQVAGAFVAADDEEKSLIRFLQKDRSVNGQRYFAMDLSEVKSRLIWRREMLGSECKGDLNTLHQEYPSVPEEAFVATGTNVFDLGRLRKVYEPIIGDRGRLVDEAGKIRFIEDASGPLEIYNYPAENREFGWYMIGGDGKKASQSVSGSAGDYACAQVINRKTWSQAARWRGRLDQNGFGEEMIRLGRYYNNAMLAPETGIGGPGVAAHIIARGYPNIWQHRKGTKMPGQVDNTWGWITNAQTKTEAIGNLQSALFDASDVRAHDLGIGIRIHDPVTYGEMKNYVVLGDGGFGNADGQKEHDDTVMALAIALTCAKYEQTMLANDPRYQAPRYHDESYKSDLTVEEAEVFEDQLQVLGVPEGDVALEGGKLLEGAGYDASWFDEPADYFAEGDYDDDL